MVAAAIVAGVATTAISAGASLSASSAQAGAAQNAQNIAQNQYANNVALENPYNQAGYNATNELQYLEGVGPSNAAGTTGTYGALNTPFNADTFKSLSPAYSFDLQQGLQGVSNADSSNMGALSGAAQKDLIGYGQSNALNSFNTAFNEYQTQNTNVYDRLANIANLGQSAASGTAQTGTALAGTAAAAATNMGNAQANGATGVANAASNGLGSAAAYGYLNSVNNQSASYGNDPNATYAPSSGSWSSDGSTWMPSSTTVP